MSYETIDYDFSNLKEAISELPYVYEENIRRRILCDIQKELNCFFKDFHCTEVIFTNNTDNEFFGIQILPKFKSADDICMLFDCDSTVRFHNYSLEFDSKLFNGDFIIDQILALLIHDINRLNSASLLKDVVYSMDCISVNTGVEIKVCDIINNAEFFLFALQDTVRKMTSAFEYIPSDLSLADDFIRSYGLAQAYEDGMFSVKNCRNNLKDQICNTAITMNWFMNNYLDCNNKVVVNDLKESIQFTGSKLVRRQIDNVIKKMSCACPLSNYYTALTESAKKKMSLASQIKYNGLKSLEDDVYEYKMRIKNIETETDAIYVIRQINNRMGIISDYLENEELTDSDRERFFKLYDKYDSLREELSKKAVYNRRMYGLFVDYNALQQLSNANNITMNTYY